MNDIKFMRSTIKPAGRFYLVRKIQNVPAEPLFSVDIPGRPIFSKNNNNPTEALFVFLNHYLSEIPALRPSFVQDTPHGLHIIKAINTGGRLSYDAFLVTLDVAALYANTPLIEGIEAISKTLEVNTQQHAPAV